MRAKYPRNATLQQGSNLWVCRVQKQNKTKKKKKSNKGYTSRHEFVGIKKRRKVSIGLCSWRSRAKFLENFEFLTKVLKYLNV